VIRSSQRKLMVSGQLADAFRPTGPTGVGAVIPSYPRSAANPYITTVLADTPALFAMLNESSGTTFGDSSGNGRTLTKNGTITLGVSTGMTNVATGVTFGGTTSDFISRATESALNITGDLTYEAWFKISALPGAQWYFMSKGFDGTNSSYGFFVNSAGALNVNAFGVGGAGMVAGGAVSTGSWHHVVFTRSGANGVIYLDGVSTVTSSGMSGPSATTTRFMVGAADLNGTANSPITGSMAAIAVYNTALSGARVSAHYAARN
jgi:hypothetical protein